MIDWRRLLDLPFLVILMGIAAAAMLLPAGHALAMRQLPVARAFFYSGLILLILTALIGLATATNRPRNLRQSHLAAVVGAYLVLPVIFAVPLHQAMPGLSFTDAWFEMLSCFTTTGATLFETPETVLAPIHFWRALVGWFGGYFILLAILAVLSPMGLGGVEMMAGETSDRGEGAKQIQRIAEPSQRLARFAGLLFPPYLAVTALLWVGLLLAGDSALVALCHAMATLSTSGISPLAALRDTGSGLWGEALIFAFLSFAVTRRFWPRTLGADRSRPMWQDPELQIAAGLLAAVVIAVVLHGWILGFNSDAALTPGGVAQAIWGAAFTALSFLTTTGFQSAHWPTVNAPGLILLGLAILGGGAATAAGGVKLLRVYALLRHGERELERIVHPHSIGGHGPVARRLRREGAHLAWIFFMLFGFSIGAVAAALTLTGQSLDAALVFAIAGITTTGQLALVVGDQPLSYADLGGTAQAVLGAAMVLGRLEILAIFAFLAPNGWGR